MKIDKGIQKIIYDSVAVLFIVVSTMLLLSSAFKELTIRVDDVAWLALLLVGVVLAEHFFCDSRKRYYIGLISLFLLFALLMYIKGNTIIGGSEHVLGVYLDAFFDYYNLSLTGIVGTPKDAAFAYRFVFFILFAGLIHIGFYFKKNRIIFIVPILILILDMIVGRNPSYVAFVFLILGFYFLEMETLRIHTMALVSILLVISYLLGTIATPRLLEKHMETKALHGKVEEFVMNLPVNFSWTETKKRITNQTPSYEEKTIMTLTSDRPLSGNLYLKNFSSGSYLNDCWLTDNTLKEDCDKEGIDVSKIQKLLFDYPKYHLTKEGREDLTHYKLHYDDLNDFYLYTSYFSAVNAGYRFIYDDDACLKWDFYQNNLEFTGLSSDTRYDLIKRNNRTMYENEWAFYNDYINKYAKNDSVDGAILVEVEPIKEYIAKNFNQKEYTDQENSYRLYAAERIQNYFATKYTYNLYLDRLEPGEDPITHFIQTKEGYCMHYATTAVLMLRELDVPCRYASGYIVHQDKMKKDGDAYKVEILDSNAHAWVEIFLEEIGWVPIEVTTVYQGTSDDNGKIPQKEINQDPQEKIQEPQQEERKESESQTQIEEEVSESEMKDNDKDTFDSDKKISKRVGVAVIISALGIVGVFYFQKRKQRIYYAKSLYHRRKYRRYIKLLNRKLYKKLLKRHLTDREYLALLIKTYPDIPREKWEKYMDIVESAAFSNEEISKESADFVSEIYTCIVRGYEVR